jgi:uncharacterized protein
MRSGISRTVPTTLARALGAVAVAGAACVAYGVFIERRWYRTNRYRVPVLPQGGLGLTVLHVSDLHFVGNDRSKAEFLRGLDRPDVAIVTGDMLGEPEGVDGVVEALRPIRGRVDSYFVLGSNDYWAPRPLNYTNYFRKERVRRTGTPSRFRELIAALEADGWTYLENGRTTLSSDGTRAEVLGLDDPHIEYHDLRVALRTDPGAVGVAIVHSPDPVPELVSLGWDLIVSGHTHGGQVRMPVVGAIVTNSDVPRRLSMGLSKFGPSYLHVSPGMGTSKYAPFRFLCRPEATYLDLVAKPA